MPGMLSGAVLSFIATINELSSTIILYSGKTGTISVAIGGMLKRHLATQTLQKLLTQELIGEGKERGGVLELIKRKNRRKEDDGDVSGS